MTTTGSGDAVPSRHSLRAAPTALLIVEVGGFPSARDGVDHPAAAAVLAFVATVLRECVGTGGSVQRWSGDTFVVLLPRTGSVPVRQVAERVRALVAALVVPVADAQSGLQRIDGLSVSIGGAVRGGTRPNLTALFWCADAALYTVRGAGGGAVRVCELDERKR